MALEAGVTLGWTKYVDEALGIDTYGMSAPGPYAFGHFNITANALVSHVVDHLGFAS